MAGETISGPFLLKRGTSDKVAAYPGPAGEIVIDLTKSTVVVQNGSAGGSPLAKESRQIIGGTGITVNSGASDTLANDITLAVNTSGIIAAADGLLKTDANGKIATALSLSFDAATGVFSIIGQDGTTAIATANLPTNVSGLVTAEMVVNPTYAETEGGSATAHTGTYLHFQYLLSSGATKDVYVNVTSLIDIYTSGDNAINITSNAITLRISATNPGLEIRNDGLGVKVAAEADNQLVYGANGGLYVPTPAATVVVSTDTGNVITAGTDSGAKLTLAASNNALTTDANGALIVPLDCGVLTGLQG